MNIDVQGPDGQPSVIAMHLSRGKQGVSVKVQAVPEVEAFFVGLSTGALEDVVAHGRHWSLRGPQHGEDGKRLKIPFRVHGLPKAMGPFSYNGGYYSLMHPGQPLWLQSQNIGINAPSAQVLNLSFLRIAGISQEGGVTFTINNMVNSLEELNNLAAQLLAASDRFYGDYLRPVDIKIGLYMR